MFQLPPESLGRGRAGRRGRARPRLDLLRQHGLRRRSRRAARQRAVARRLGTRWQGGGGHSRLRHPADQGHPRRHAGPLQPAGRRRARHLRDAAAAGSPLRRPDRAAHDAAARRRSSCRVGRSTPTAPLCDRDAAVADVKARFGAGPGSTNDLLYFLCGGKAKPSSTSTCLRYIQEPTTIRAVAGHMHLLGRSIKIEVNPGTPQARTVLDIKPTGTSTTRAPGPIEPIQLQPVRHRQGDLPPRPVAARRRPGLRDPARGPLRRLGRGHHRRDVPRHPHRHPPVASNSRLRRVALSRLPRFAPRRRTATRLVGVAARSRLCGARRRRGRRARRAAARSAPRGGATGRPWGRRGRGWCATPYDAAPPTRSRTPRRAGRRSRP